ncbi:hypothetical protein OsI_16735 [Oryza sativa Indica Group]|uniref:Uncharacterized protein n=3 Tax=Oryza TaxID=4527 RepID=A2XVS1_ORYSI|nr:hypothetical protein OsI_16735 [Oryza sativa Indica Group]CAJ86374.1 OSIGBa0155K17.1 [Oryza sativa]
MAPTWVGKAARLGGAAGDGDSAAAAVLVPSRAAAGATHHLQRIEGRDRGRDETIQGSPRYACCLLKTVADFVVPEQEASFGVDSLNP